MIVQSRPRLPVSWVPGTHLYTFGRIPWTGGHPVDRPVPTRDNIHAENTQIYTNALSGLRNPRSQNSNGENSTRLKLRGLYYLNQRVTGRLCWCATGVWGEDEKKPEKIED
jgi:hypothetical protein